MATLSGKYLNSLWGVNAKHALYFHEGTWYHHLKNFPGVLFDRSGYLLIKSPKEYKECKYFKAGKELHIPNGISSIPGYKKITEKGDLQEFSIKIRALAEKNLKQTDERNHLSSKIGVEPIAIDIPKGNSEIQRAPLQALRIMRNIQVSKWVKFLHSHKCQICGETLYLRSGKRYSESHHIKPLGKPHNGPDVVENVICVCPNHHVLLDYGAITLDKDQLLMIPEHDISDEYIKYHNTKIIQQES